MPFASTSHRVRLLAIAGVLLMLAGCSRSDETDGATTQNDGTVADEFALIADDAVAFTMIAAGISPPMRPSVQMGIYGSLFLSGGGFLLSSTAVQGAVAQTLYHMRPTADRIDATYALLEEFATILQVDIPDLLNRSQDRAGTLEEYLQGLRNITARSQQKTRELDQLIETLTEEQRTQRRETAALEREREDALEEQNFVNAGELQQRVADAQAALARLESDLELQTDLQDTFDQLLEVATERVAAVEGNREILIAGLRVIEVPGVDDLGILERTRQRRAGVF